MGQSSSDKLKTRNIYLPLAALTRMEWANLTLMSILFPCRGCRRSAGLTRAAPSLSLGFL
jgi:hypothetical protein